MSSRDGRTPRRSGGNCGFHLSREECESSILLVSGKYLPTIYNVEWAIVINRAFWAITSPQSQSRPAGTTVNGGFDRSEIASRARSS